MKRLSIFLVLLAGVYCVQAQTINLSAAWKFTIGDDTTWASVSFNDSLWDTKEVGHGWSALDRKENVYAWYRTRVVVPSTMKSAIEKGNGLKLSLGMIDDVDQTFFNGKLIGQSGSFLPQYKTAWDSRRAYIVAPQNIRYDEENVIAVRVFSPDVGGIGMYEGPYTITPVQWSDFVSMSHAISRADNDSFVASVSLSNKGRIAYKGTLKYIITAKSKKELYRESKQVIVAAESNNGFSFAPFQSGSNDVVEIECRFIESETNSSIGVKQFYLCHQSVNIPVAAELLPAVQDKVPVRFTFLPFDDQKLNGYLEKRMQQNLEERLLKVDEKGIIDPFLQRPGNHPWAGEHIGKYLEAASNMWMYTHDVRLKKQMDRMMYALISTQLEDGYLGTYGPDKYWTGWDVWSHKYDLYGLIGYYKRTGYQPALDACKQIGDLLCRTFGNNPGQRDIILAGEHIGMAATSVLDPMVELYRFTGEKKYLDFCYYILDAYEQKNGPKIISTLIGTGQVNKVANGKAYEMLSNIVGLVNLYKMTGDEKFLTPALLAWSDIVAKRLYITGTTSSFEHFQDDNVLPAADKDHIGEGCLTVTWIQLNHALLEVTGEVRFLEQIEKSIYNHLLGAENPQNGCVSYYTPLMDKKPYSPSITCCGSSVPRGIAMIPYFTVGNINNVPTVLLYEPASYSETILTKNKKQIEVSLNISGNFPEQGEMISTVNPSQSATFPIALRVPSWCTSFKAAVGKKVFKGTPGELLTITRRWKAKEKVKISFDLPTQIISGGKSYPDRIAFQRGPQILAYDTAVNTDSLKNGTAQNFLVDTSQWKYMSKLLPKGWIGKQLYTVPIAESDTTKREIVLVPYADASQTGGDIQVWLPLRGK